MKTLPAWDKQALLHSQIFSPLHECIGRFGQNNFPTLQECNALLETIHPAICVSNGLPLRFVLQVNGKLPFEAQYEPRCYLKGEVPTREFNWHDLLNALIWLTFPKTKATINALHYRSLTTGKTAESEASASQRGAVRDRLTLLDESGVIVAYSDEGLATLLREFQWKKLFWQHRPQIASGMGFYLFGHGLYEKALNPYIGMTGQGVLLRVEQEFFNWPLAQRLTYLDVELAGHLSAQANCRDTRELSPVPLLGVPGWTAENERAEYYDNTAYFRSGRQSRAQRTPLFTAPSSVAGYSPEV